MGNIWNAKELVILPEIIFRFWILGNNIQTNIQANRSGLCSETTDNFTRKSKSDIQQEDAQIRETKQQQLNSPTDFQSTSCYDK